MKTGKTLTQLAQEIERQSNAKRDFIVPTPALKVVADRGQVAIEFGDQRAVINDLAHRQIAEHAGIPIKYYDRMREQAPELLAQNIHEWFMRDPAKRMIRTLDGKVRAFMSDRYRPLENSELCEAVLPPLLEAGVEVLSCDVTETRLYIKAVDQRIARDIPKGGKMGDGKHVIFDTCCPAITIANSEVGMGMLAIQTSVFTKACTNLGTFGDTHIKKYHIGGKHEIQGDAVYSVLSDQTRRLTDAALWAQSRDVVRAAFSEAQFASTCKKLTEATHDKIENPTEIIELTAKKFGVGENEKTSILKHLIEGGDLSRYGLFNAVTRTAEDLASYDRATDFERMGGQIIELSKNEWADLAKAA